MMLGVVMMLGSVRSFWRLLGVAMLLMALLVLAMLFGLVWSGTGSRANSVGGVVVLVQVTPAYTPLPTATFFPTFTPVPVRAVRRSRPFGRRPLE